MSTNQWLLTAMGILLALGGVGATEFYLPATVFWISVAALLSLLALWKYRARWYLGQQADSEWTVEQIEAVKPMAYLWLAAYFGLGFGLITLVLASWYYRWTIPIGMIIPLFATWWIRFETWAIFLNRSRETPPTHQLDTPGKP